MSFRKKSCSGCKALSGEGSCGLGYEIFSEAVYLDGSWIGVVYRRKGECPKPRTFKDLVRLSLSVNSNKKIR